MSAPMTLERAREITSQCVRSSMSVVIGDEYIPLPADCTLAEMLEANRIIGQHREKPGPDGSTYVSMNVADRWIAAHYAFEQYGRDPIQLLEALGFTLKDEEPK